jgi:hypothetical protein
MAAQPQPQTQDMFPSMILQRMMKRWWLIAGLIMIGGVLGALFPFLRKPVYESNAVITTVIDYAYAGKLSDLEEDHMIVAIGNVINSTAVMQQVQAQAAEKDLSLSQQDLEKKFSLSRLGYNWELSTRFEDAGTAQSMNRIWLNAAIQALQEVRASSVETLKLLSAGNSLEACFAESVEVEPAATACDAEDLQKLISQFSANAPDQAQIERTFLMSRISIKVTREPTLAEEPAIFNRNLTTLAGGLTGLIVAVAIFVLSNAKSNSPKS